jgi:hypothetical protein
MAKKKIPENREKKVKDLRNESWKKIATPVPSNRVNYYISNKGRLKSISKKDKSEYLLNPSPDRQGYMRSSVKLEDRNYAIYVHMQVAKYWSKKPTKNQVKYIHKDLDRSNNKPGNVVWVTEEKWKQYIKDRAKKFGFVAHRKGGKPKLTEKQVAQIKKYLAQGKMMKKKIAEKYDVSHTQINRIESGENWSHVKAKK